MKAIQYYFHRDKFGLGFDIYPYQLTLGLSLRYWPRVFAPAFRLYFGPFKVWGWISV